MNAERLSRTQGTSENINNKPVKKDRRITRAIIEVYLAAGIGIAVLAGATCYIVEQFSDFTPHIGTPIVNK